MVLDLFAQIPKTQLRELQLETRRRLVLLREYSTEHDMQHLELDERTQLDIEMALEEEVRAKLIFRNSLLLYLACYTFRITLCMQSFILCSHELVIFVIVFFI